MENYYLEILNNLFQLILSVVSLLAIIVSALFTRGSRRDVADSINKSNLDAETKQKIKKNIQRWKLTARISLGILALTTLLFLGTVVWRIAYPIDRSDLSQYLIHYDSRVFESRNDALFEIARVFPDRQSLSKEADLGTIIRTAKSSFDLIAEHGSSVLVDYNAEIMEAVKRGVHFRILILDPQTLRSGGQDELVNIITRGREGLVTRVEQVIQMMAKMQSTIASDKATYRGNLTFRLLSKPLLYRMWIRDASQADHTIAHISINQYRGNQESPSFRSSNKLSERFLKTMLEDFEVAWQHSVRWQAKLDTDG